MNSKMVLRTAQRSVTDQQAAIATLNEEFKRFKSIGQLNADSDFVFKAGELIRQLAVDQFMMTDPTDMIFDRISGAALGDWIEIEEYVNTAKVVQRSLGGKPRVFEAHKRKYPITMEDWRLDFGFELEKLATGQIDVSVWVTHMAEALSRFYVSEALDTLDAACAGGVNDAYGRPVRTQISTAVDNTTIDAALRRLGDVNENTVIMGRYYALYPLFKMDNNLSEISAEEFRQRGAIGKFRGATVVVLRDGYNPFFSSATVPANRIYLAGAEKGGVLAETDMSSMNYTVVDVEEQHLRSGMKGRTSYNIFKPWRYHVIEIT